MWGLSEWKSPSYLLSPLSPNLTLKVITSSQGNLYLPLSWLHPHPLPQKVRYMCSCRWEWAAGIRRMSNCCLGGQCLSWAVCPWRTARLPEKTIPWAFLWQKLERSPEYESVTTVDSCAKMSPTFSVPPFQYLVPLWTSGGRLATFSNNDNRILVKFECRVNKWFLTEVCPIYCIYYLKFKFH